MIASVACKTNVEARHRFARAAVLCLAVLVVSAACRCATSDTVLVGAPHDRYDHNRAVQIFEWSYHERQAGGDAVDKTITLGRLARDEAYTPRGYPTVPAAAQSGTDPDALPAAHLVPIFTGVRLPLESAGHAGEPSDRDDLVDFLGSGPAAKAGVEPTEVQGLLPDEVASRYGAILELLASAPQLADRRSVLSWTKTNGVRCSFDIRDSRYPASAFADRLALQHGDFWFVLFMLPREEGSLGPPGYSRLVVVPAGPLEQTPEKRPAS